MFFIGLFGVNNKEKDLGSIEFKCTGCLSNRARLTQTATNFHIFFIPVYSWNKRYLAICEKCGSTYIIKDLNIKSVLEKKKAVYEDLSGIVSENRVCPTCSYPLYGQDYKYCPKCGRKL